MIVSAKSWLSHSGVNREAALLPWHGAEDVIKLSPGNASSRYLAHIRNAWDNAHPDQPLAEQSVVLTVPASFDEIARELTVEAARAAGLPRLCLLEEPQAAFYAWMRNGERLDEMTPGQTILVCDIGGGTTDLTLIETREGSGQEPLSYHRIAVGEHLLLGGDNLDLALAHHVEQKLGESDRLAPAVWSVLVRRCQQAKEILLQAEAPETFTISLPARGRSVIGGSRQVVLNRRDVLEQLVSGFLPDVQKGERPAARRSGFQEFGLPYAPDAAITRYIMAFLEDQGQSEPDYILFNGGFFESEVLRNRLLAVLEKALNWKPKVLKTRRLDLAVAHGAAEYAGSDADRARESPAALRAPTISASDRAIGSRRRSACFPPDLKRGTRYSLRTAPLSSRFTGLWNFRSTPPAFARRTAPATCSPLMPKPCARCPQSKP